MRVTFASQRFVAKEIIHAKCRIYTLSLQAFTSKQLLLLLPSARSICSTFIPTTEYFALQEISADKNSKIAALVRVVFTLIRS